MYIVVAGGGKVGFYLARALINEGHEVLVIERDRRKCEIISEELGSVVTRGDAAELSTLSEAGVNRADVVVAVTGDDEDNLVICQLAKKKFTVPRTIARINNPKNEHIFRLLGIDATVSSTEVIMSYIEHELPTRALVHLLRLRRANLEIVEATIPDGARVVGHEIREIKLPPESVVLMVVRGGTPIVPSGMTVLQAGDEIISLTKSDQERDLRDVLLE
jgi:trk system potassium uptake protein TrkA